MSEYLVKCSYPDLIHPPANIYVSYILTATSYNNAAHRATRFAVPSIEGMLKKMRANPYAIQQIAQELLTIMSVDKIGG